MGFRIEISNLEFQAMKKGQLHDHLLLCTIVENITFEKTRFFKEFNPEKDTATGLVFRDMPIYL